MFIVHVARDHPVADGQSRRGQVAVSRVRLRVQVDQCQVPHRGQARRERRAQVPRVWRLSENQAHAQHTSQSQAQEKQGFQSDDVILNIVNCVLCLGGDYSDDEWQLATKQICQMCLMNNCMQCE